MKYKKSGEGTSPAQERSQSQNPRVELSEEEQRTTGGGLPGVYTGAAVGEQTHRHAESTEKRSEDEIAAEAEEELGLEPVVKSALDSGPKDKKHIIRD